jgi:hypothetical protein
MLLNLTRGILFESNLRSVIARLWRAKVGARRMALLPLCF